MLAIRAALESRPPVPPVDTLDAWQEATGPVRDAYKTTLDRALVGGALADRLGFAFASGYHEALRALVPSLAGDVAALCATEAGGNQPRHILTELVPDGAGYRLTGKKKWATWSGRVRTLLVVASVGPDETGRNRLRVARVSIDAAGVTATPKSAPFIPEIPHAEIEFANVVVDAADVLPGDGYDRFLKPFRTVEDIHVYAALAGYLIGVCRRRGIANDAVEQLAALALGLGELAVADPSAAETHVALAGAIALASTVVTAVEQAWSANPDDEWGRWQRDRVVLGVAAAARSGRRERAWETINLRASR